MNDFAGFLDEYAPGQLEALNLPGAVVGLIEDSTLVTAACYGQANPADAAPLTPQTLFQICSISKSFTAWGVMKLVEQGKLDLDAPVEDYLTRWSFPPSDYDSRAVTARLLLMHYGGTSLSGCGSGEPGAWSYSPEGVLRGDVPPANAMQREYAKRWDIDPDQYGVPVHLMCAPGERFEYSGGGFTILELLIEELSGRDFPSFMQTEILDPLGMRDSGFALRDAQQTRVATPHDETGAPMPLYAVNGLAAGGMYSSLEDMARFACAEMPGPNGEAPGRGVLAPESIAEMHRPDRFAEEEMGLQFYTGLGHYVVDLGEIRAIQHTGGNPGWRTVYTVIPAAKLGFVCLINSAGGNEFWMDLINRWSEAVLLG